MWNPDENESEPEVPRAQFLAELAAALPISSITRARYGIRDNDDGTYSIADLSRITSEKEDVRAVLRDFLQGKYRQAPGDKSEMSEETRQRIKEMYAKLDRLDREAPKRRILKGGDHG